VTDEDGSPVAGALLEIWQANAAGRYVHKRDDWPGPLDPNFLGIGRCLTNAAGEYRFLTVRPGAYPWGNHENAWRPAHIHFSALAPSWHQRLVTQMYFPDDPLLPLDPIFNAVPAGARSRLVAAYAHDVTRSHWALGWRWNIVLAGPSATTFEARVPGAA
jgi:protocatechuate 3,4-dioxygenase beta subunit